MTTARRTITLYGTRERVEADVLDTGHSVVHQDTGGTHRRQYARTDDGRLWTIGRQSTWREVSGHDIANARRAFGLTD